MTKVMGHPSLDHNFVKKSKQWDYDYSQVKSKIRVFPYASISSQSINSIQCFCCISFKNSEKIFEVDSNDE